MGQDLLSSGGSAARRQYRMLLLTLNNDQEKVALRFGKSEDTEMKLQRWQARKINRAIQPAVGYLCRLRCTASG
jgi:hypothetical protein